MPNQILLIDCPDEKGLVYKATGVIFDRGANVLSNHEFVDPELSHFYMRTEFTGDIEPSGLIAELKKILPVGAKVRISDCRPRDIVVLATKEHHCLAELLVRHTYHELGARILAVISNHELLKPLVNRFEIPFHFVPSDRVSRQEHEEALLPVIEQFAPEYIVLAKYMRILSPAFVSRFEERIINIHHSFLPAFVGANPYRQAYERGVKIIGATAHFVTAELDRGPIIAQSVIPVDHTHGPDEMAQAGRDVEKIVLARAIKQVFEQRVFLSGNRTVIFK